MGAPFGNKNAIGNRGGRKTALEEREAARLAIKFFTEDIDKDKLARKIERNRHSILELMVFKALNGNERAISTMYKKLAYVNWERLRKDKKINERVQNLMKAANKRTFDS